MVWEKHTILEDVRKGNLYGMVEVDIEVPECLWEHFSKMSPLFCTCAVPFQVIGEKIQVHVKKYDTDKRPRKLLVGGMKAKKLLLLTLMFTEMVFGPWFAHDQNLSGD